MVVYCAPGSFFALCVSFTFLLIFAPVCCISLYSASISFAAVGLTCDSFGFPVSLLGYSVLIKCSPASSIGGCFFLLSFWFLPSFISASSVSTQFARSVFCLSVFLFCRMVYHYTRLSRCWFHASAPFLRFSPLRPLLSHQLGYSG